MPSPAAGSAPLACRYRVGYPGPTRACGAAPAVYWARTTLRRAGLPRVTPGPYCDRHHPERLAREEAARRRARAAKRAAGPVTVRAWDMAHGPDYGAEVRMRVAPDGTHTVEAVRYTGGAA